MRRDDSTGPATGLKPARPLRRAMLAALFMIALMALLSGCASSRREGPPTAGAFNARVIYIIHGDADYVYHDDAGRKRRADEDALQQAREAGARTTGAEVFVFHQKSEWATRVWGGSEGRLYHYRYGTLQSRETYFRNPGNLEAEAGLVRRHAAPAAAVEAGRQMRHIPLVLAYFGHEIPRTVAGKDDSSTLNRERFVSGLTDIATAAELAEIPVHDSAAVPVFHSLKKPYGLIILSVCNGGTPGMMKALAPLADYAVASPARLHLSHLDARALGDIARTDSVRARKPWKRLADSVAVQSFARLKEKTLTEITVAVYDLDQTESFVSSAAMNESKVESGSASEGKTVWRDCGTMEGFDARQARRGVTLLYRAPRFGPDKDVTSRSPWQCETTPTARRPPAE